VTPVSVGYLIGVVAVDCAGLGFAAQPGNTDPHEVRGHMPVFGIDVPGLDGRQTVIGAFGATGRREPAQGQRSALLVGDSRRHAIVLGRSDDTSGDPDDDHRDQHDHREWPSADRTDPPRHGTPYRTGMGYGIRVRGMAAEQPLHTHRRFDVLRGPQTTGTALLAVL